MGIKLTASTPASLFESKPELTSLEGKSILVTGGSGGLGEALVRRLAGAGAYVTIADIKTEAGEAVAYSINKQGHRANFFRCDVTEWEDQVAAFKSAVRFGPDGGRLDHVIINAGVFDTPFMTGADGGVASLDEDPPRPDATPIEVNTKGAMYTLKLSQLYLLMPTAAKADPDHTKSITFVMSPEGYATLPGSVIYGGSKFGNRGLFRTSRELFAAKAIRVNALVPWLMDTPMNTDVAALLTQFGLRFTPLETHVEVVMHLMCSSVVNSDASFGAVGERREIAGRAVAVGGTKIVDLDDDESGGDGGPKLMELLHTDMSPTREKMLMMYGALGVDSDKQRKWMF